MAYFHGSKIIVFLAGAAHVAILFPERLKEKK
jgi:hypothetical protein